LLFSSRFGTIWRPCGEFLLSCALFLAGDQSSAGCRYANGRTGRSLAAPIGFDRIDSFPTVALNTATDFGDILATDTIAEDLSICSTAGDPLFEQITGDAQLAWISTDLGTNPAAIGRYALSEAESAVGRSGIRAPEPPALATITLGLAGLGLLALRRRMQRARREALRPLKGHRIRVPMREYGLSSPHFMARW
jgi:hypothetical protein